MDRTSNSGFEPFFWPLLYKSQSWFLAGWIYGQNLKFWLSKAICQAPEVLQRIFSCLAQSAQLRFKGPTPGWSTCRAKAPDSSDLLKVSGRV